MSDDDALHIRNPAHPLGTLCAQGCHVVLSVQGIDDERPDWWSGCWTCLQEAARIDKGLHA